MRKEEKKTRGSMKEWRNKAVEEETGNTVNEGKERCEVDMERE